MEYWRPSILYAIGRGIGSPLKIDRKTLDREIGFFARVLIDVDLAKNIPEKFSFREGSLNSLCSSR